MNTLQHDAEMYLTIQHVDTWLSQYDDDTFVGEAHSGTENVVTRYLKDVVGGEYKAISTTLYRGDTVPDWMPVPETAEMTRLPDWVRAYLFALDLDGYSPPRGSDDPDAFRITAHRARLVLARQNAPQP